MKNTVNILKNGRGLVVEYLPDNAPVRIVVSFIVPEKSDFYSVGDTIFYFSEDLSKKGIYYGVVYKMEDITFILKSIVNGEVIYLTSETTPYMFDFSKYKNDIKKSDFYKKIMQ